LEETAVLDLISPPQGAPLLSALGDIAGFRHDDLKVVPDKMYDNPITGTTTSLDFAELAPQHIVRVGFGGTNIGVSSDGGATWTPGTSLAGGGGVVALSADGASMAWSPANATVSYSLDNGQTWTASSGLPAGARVGSDRADASRFYAYAAGVFYMSVDRGATFATTGAAGLPRVIPRCTRARRSEASAESSAQTMPDDTGFASTTIGTSMQSRVRRSQATLACTGVYT
jgi:hypothetical protein